MGGIARGAWLPRAFVFVAIGEPIGKDEIERPPGDPGRHREAVDGKVVRVEEVAGVVLARRPTLEKTMLVEETRSPL